MRRHSWHTFQDVPRATRTHTRASTLARSLARYSDAPILPSRYSGTQSHAATDGESEILATASGPTGGATVVMKREVRQDRDTIRRSTPRRVNNVEWPRVHDLPRVNNLYVPHPHQPEARICRRRGNLRDDRIYIHIYIYGNSITGTNIYWTNCTQQ